MQSIVVALAGNPNCGKTTLFNSLTGSKQSVGNWAGVTVSQTRRILKEVNTNIEIVDLPGCYECTPVIEKECAQDEYLACKYILSREADLILNIVDATHLERHLYLTLQMLELELPLIVVLNMMDIANLRGLHIEVDKLSQLLGCPVVAISARKGYGIQELKQHILTWQETHQDKTKKVEQQKISLTEKSGEATERFQQIHTMMQSVVTNRNKTKWVKSWTEKIDNIVLNRYLSLPIFLLFIYILFVITIDIGKFFQAYFDIGAKFVFVEKFSQYLIAIGSPRWLIALLAEGVGQGINTTVSFIPVIGLLYFCMAFLESSGYMARAAFIMDGLMRYVGLPGKSFVPLILGFGCNVPAILGARTLENQRERILTILMTPFMSCGARLAIFAIFVTAFFSNHGAIIIFSLYLVGIGIALATGFFLRNTLLPGHRAPLIMELPSYQWPSFKIIWRSTYFRVTRFVLKAGTLIIPLCAVIGLCSVNKLESNAESSFAYWGKKITPIFAPMGVTEENWPAAVGLLTGVVAKEVVVGTLNALYLQEAEQPVAVSARLDKPTALGIMAQRFESTAAAFSYLLFVLLYFPCVSVIAVIGRELNKFWAIFSAVWTTGIAYGVAVVFYQSTLIKTQPMVSFTWIVGVIASVVGLFCVLKYMIAGRNSLVEPLKHKPLPTQIYITNE